MIGTPVDQATPTIERCSPQARGGTYAASSLPRPGQMSGSKLLRWSGQQRGTAKISGPTWTLSCAWLPGLAPEEVAAEWTARLYEIHGAIAHLDIWSGPALYRVFLLGSSLQIDLSFWPSDAFAESGGPFRLLFGQANEPAPSPARSADALIGMGWLYALHARSSIARGRALQALYMINGVRDQVISLVCLREAGRPGHQEQRRPEPRCAGGHPDAVDRRTQHRFRPDRRWSIEPRADCDQHDQDHREARRVEPGGSSEPGQGHHRTTQRPPIILISWLPPWRSASARVSCRSPTRRRGIDPPRRQIERIDRADHHTSRHQNR